MKVINKTNYDTRYLRSLFIKCEKHEGTNHKHREVRVIFNRHTWRIGGYAWYDSSSVVMKLPRKEANIRRVAQVYIHEVGHNLGLHHKDMSFSNTIDVSWLPDENILLKKPKVAKSKLNIVEVRAKRAQKKLDGWNKKLNQAKTFVKKYRAKVKYYEKKMAASPTNIRKDS